MANGPLTVVEYVVYMSMVMLSILDSSWLDDDTARVFMNGPPLEV